MIIPSCCLMEYQMGIGDRTSCQDDSVYSYSKNDGSKASTVYLEMVK
jgi:hypothetical protein